MTSGQAGEASGRNRERRLTDGSAKEGRAGIVKGVSGLTLARIFSSLLQAAILVLLARELGPRGFGIFSALLMAGVVYGNLLGFGATSQALRLAASPNPRGLASTLLMLRVPSAAFAAGLGVVTVAVVLSANEQVWLIASIYLVAELITELVQSILLGSVALTRANVIVIARRLIPFSGMVVALIAGKDVAVALTIGMSVATLFSLTVCASFLGKPGRPLRTLRDGRHYWTSTALISLQNLDVLIVGALAGPTSGGYFAAANRLMSPVNMATSAVLAILTPRMSRMSGVEERRMLFVAGRRFVGALCLALILASPLVAWAAPFVLGDEYSGAGVLFAFMTIAAGINGLTQTYAARFYAEGSASRLASIRLAIVPLGLACVALASISGGLVALGGAVVITQLAHLAALHVFDPSATGSGVKFRLESGR